MQPDYDKHKELFGHVGELPLAPVEHVHTNNPNYAYYNIPLEVAGNLPIDWLTVFQFCKDHKEDPYVRRFLEPKALLLRNQAIPRFKAKTVYIPEAHGLSVPELIELIQVKYDYRLGTPDQAAAWVAQRITNGEPEILKNIPPLITKGRSGKTINFNLGPPSSTPPKQNAQMPSVHFSDWSNAVKNSPLFIYMQTGNFMSRCGFLKSFYCDPYETKVVHDGAACFLVKEF